jgi:hypothetical protein
MKEEKLKTVRCRELLDVSGLQKDPHLKLQNAKSLDCFKSHIREQHLFLGRVIKLNI